MRQSILVVGASSSIAQAIISRFINTDVNCRIVAITRSYENIPTDSILHNTCVERIYSDYSESSIKDVSDTLKAQAYLFDFVFICNGVLHSEHLMPEKRLADFDSQSFLSIMHSNTLIPILWLAQLEKLLNKKAFVTVLSARVGSISDNQLGGWYSYRASKAALNMLVKTAAIELNRRHKNWRFVLFHPGTTDTGLSKPFQKNVAKGKLFAPDFVASQLLSILHALPEEMPAQYLDWEGKAVDW